MKSKITPFLALLTLTASVHGTALTWDVAPGDGATITAGSGNWLTGGPNWNTGAADANWTAGDTATFQAPNDLGIYTISVGGAVTTGQAVPAITFNNSGFTLQSSSAQTITIGTTNPDASINIASGKSATLGDNLTIRKGGTAGIFGLFGGGTLSIGSGTPNGGAVLQNNGTSASFEMRNGTTVDVKSGGLLSCSRSYVVGSTVADTNTHRLKISGGTVLLANGGSAACNVVVGNNTNGQTSTAIVDITGGELNNQTTDGSLRFGPATAGASTNCTATVNLDGGILTLARIFQGTQSGGGVITSTFNFNGGTLRVLPGTISAATYMAGLKFAYVRSGGAIIDTNGITTNNGNAVIGQALLDGTGGGGLTKEGVGTLTLTGANTYTGPTIVNGGKLAITAPYNAITATTVNNTGRLKVNSSGVAPSSLGNVSLNSGSGLEFDLGTYNSANQPALAIGTLNANANYAIDLSGVAIPSGATITLLTYTSKTGPGIPLIGNLPLGVTLTGAPVDTGSSIQVTIANGSPTPFTWSKGDGDWDTASLNWNTNSVAYGEPAVVTFPTLTDAGDGVNTVNLTANRSPFLVTITNTGDYDTTAYNFTGSGAITGATGIAKSGSGIARFNTPANSYSGTLAISAGAVLKETADNTTGNITVATDATFALVGNITDGGGQTATISGPGHLNLNYFYSGSFNQRGALQAQKGNVTWAGDIALAGTPGSIGTTRIGVQNGATLTITGTISETVAGMSPYFRSGDTPADVITIAGPCAWTGPTRIYSNGGIVAISGNDRLPTTVELIVGNTAGASGSPTFDLAGFNQTVAGLGGADGSFLPVVRNSGGSQSILTVNPTNPGTYPGIIQDNLKLVVGGTATQALSGQISHTGDTTINAGANLIVGTTGELKLYPTSNGITNSIGGPGSLQFDGTLRVVLDGANPSSGNSWKLVDTNSLAQVTYGPNFNMLGWGFFTETPVDSGIWKLDDLGTVWTFTEATGMLTVTSPATDPFGTWINGYFPGETDPAIIGKGADPDGDGVNNFAEFALGGTPDNGTYRGYHVMAVEDTDADNMKELTLTIAVRKAGGSPVFSGSPLSATAGGVTYTIEGAIDLGFPGSTASETPSASGPDGLPPEYEYRRFRLDASEGLAGKGFLRVKTAPSP